MHSLPYILPLLLTAGSKPSITEVRNTVLKVLRQRDFSGAAYVLIVGQMIEAAECFEGSLKGDIEFWRQLLQYMPEVQLESIDQYCRLRASIQHLAE